MRSRSPASGMGSASADNSGSIAVTPPKERLGRGLGSAEGSALPSEITLSSATFMTLERLEEFRSFGFTGHVAFVFSFVASSSSPNKDWTSDVGASPLGSTARSSSLSSCSNQSCWSSLEGATECHCDGPGVATEKTFASVANQSSERFFVFLLTTTELRADDGNDLSRCGVLTANALESIELNSTLDRALVSHTSDSSDEEETFNFDFAFEWLSRRASRREDRSAAKSLENTRFSVDWEVLGSGEWLRTFSSLSSVTGCC
mmetsp:Transcript_59853/g.159320  ORF Transcript_59853/g.159320 Transcript_59853/m.159320 type:complete len:261 (-) Transcript_59853:1470-2252(-)